MTFQDMRSLINNVKVELHKDMDSLEVKIDKSNAVLYKEIKETNRKLDMILEAIGSVRKSELNENR